MSQKQLPAPGIYDAKTNGKLVVYIVEKSGNLAVKIPVQLVGVDPPFTTAGQMVIAKADGSLNTKNIATLRKIFPGWTDASPMQLMNIDTTENVFSVTCAHEAYTPEATDDNPNPQSVDMFKIQWFNAAGGLMPDAAQEQDVMARWGAAFKTTVAGQSGSIMNRPVKEVEKPSAPARKMPGKKAANPLNTADAVFDALVAKKMKENPKAKKADLEDASGSTATAFWSAADSIAPDGDLTAAQWSECADKLGV